MAASISYMLSQAMPHVQGERVSRGPLTTIHYNIAKNHLLVKLALAVSIVSDPHLTLLMAKAHADYGAAPPDTVLRHCF